MALVLTMGGCTFGPFGTFDPFGGDECDAAASADLVLDDCHNYTQESSLSFGRYEVQPAPPELTIDWAGLTQDMRGRPVVPGDVDQVYLSTLAMTEEELADAVERNELDRSSAASWVWGNEAHATTMLASELEALGNPVDLARLVPEEGTTWALSLLDVADDASEFQVVTTVLLDPVEGGPGQISIESGASSATGTADLHTGAALLATAGASSYTLDWSSLETDVFGRPFDSLVANTLVIVNYPGLVGDAEADFLLLDYNATAVYTLDVFGETSAQLDQAVDADGASFPGFSTDGTWLAALVDDGSLSPVPLVMAVVEVE